MLCFSGANVQKLTSTAKLRLAVKEPAGVATGGKTEILIREYVLYIG